MTVISAGIGGLLQCADQALRSAGSVHGAALVDRTCPFGSLGRGTRAVDSEEEVLVAFLNVDLQFGSYEVSEAVAAMSTTLQSALELAGWRFQLHVTDAECRGGQWAELRCWGHTSTNRTGTAVPSDAAAGTRTAAGVPAGNGSDGIGADAVPSGGQLCGTSASDDGQAAVVHLFLAENMARSVRTAGPGQDEAAIGAEVAQAEGDCNALDWCPVDLAKAGQQQENLLAAAESHIRRQARHPARHSAAVDATTWATKASCGTAEAQRVFWSRQPADAIRTARVAHGAWQRVVGAAQQPREGAFGTAAGVLDAAGRPSGAAPTADDAGAEGVGSTAQWDDAVMHLLDVLALHAYGEVAGGPPGHMQMAGEPPAEPMPPVAQQQPQHGEGSAVKRLFTILATDHLRSGVGLRVAVPGGILSGEQVAVDAPAGAAENEAVGTAQEPRLEVLDPCFPAQDLYAAACQALGQAGGVSDGRQVLLRLASEAVKLTA